MAFAQQKRSDGNDEIKTIFKVKEQSSSKECILGVLVACEACKVTEYGKRLLYKD